MGHVIPQRVVDRFWSRVTVSTTNECWEWKMSSGSHGYGQVGWSAQGRNYMVLAHRVAYEIAKGPIPADLTVDHICRHRRCCNPAHLRLLTNLENARSNAQSLRTHCPLGHPYSGDNLGIRGRQRWCRQCMRIHNANRSLRSN